MSQDVCLATKRPPSNDKNNTNLVTTFGAAHKTIQKILTKHWYLLPKDPYHKSLLPLITFRRPPTLNANVAVK